MKKIDLIIENLRNHVPQAVNRFNDGEVNVITGVGDVSRGQQPVTSQLQTKMIEALSHEQENYWVGLPCKTCWPKCHEKAADYVNLDYDQLTTAVVLINENYSRFKKFLLQVLPDYEVHYICGENQNTDRLQEYLKTDIHVTYVGSQNAWASFGSLKGKKFPAGSFVGVSCGAAGRALVYEWFKSNPDSTFIDLGSFFDPITLKRKFTYHSGSLKECPECNRKSFSQKLYTSIIRKPKKLNRKLRKLSAKN